MSQGNTKGLFEAKVAELAKATMGLPIPHLLTLRRLTKKDPESLRWASERQLDAVFHFILDRAVEAFPVEELDAAALRQFDPLLPPGSDDEREQDRWLLYDLTRKRIAERPKPPAVDPANIDDVAPLLPDDPPIETNSFAGVFDETLARCTRRAFQVAATRGERHPVSKPFYLQPDFGRVYEEVLRRCLLPDVRATKRVKQLAASRKWTGADSGRLMALVQNGDNSNPLLESWDSRWNAFHSQGVGAKKAKLTHDPWQVFRDAAEAGSYQAPGEHEIAFLRAVLRWDADAMADGWRQICQTYQQEFLPASKYDAARPNSVRDCVIKVVQGLQGASGDVLAIKAFFTLPKCDRMFLRNLMHSIGGSDTERKRVAPFLVTFYHNLPP
ncbi:MAG: hypothetical protein ACM31L_01615 [Actinomycetota bacterium]